MIPICRICAALFGRDRFVIGRHIRNVFAEGELGRASNVQNLHIAGSDKPVSFYTLDVIPVAEARR